MDSIKCVFVGDKSVGKTSILATYAYNAFPELYIPKVFDDHNFNKLIDGKNKWIGLKDTATDDCRRSYPNANVFILVFSVVDPDSVNNVREKWFRELRNYAPKIPIILVGSKADLRENRRTVQSLESQGQTPVDMFEGTKMAKEIGAVEYVQCSAKNGTGLHSVFEKAINAALHK
eukprot:gb/GECH01008944.1/.p1 GENE.gb/GECH01008944.1/~~gb/GECH01008944.1/.p1  ORF type:complete len:175 (+),score=15.48 gb/GECH01008944.1/:1-525(+)